MRLAAMRDAMHSSRCYDGMQWLSDESGGRRKRSCQMQLRAVLRASVAK